MSEKTRGSDQLKQQCPGLSALTPEELDQVTGGAFLVYKDYFPIGIPWPIEMLKGLGGEVINPAVGQVNIMVR